MKKHTLFILVFIFGCLIFTGCSKDEILGHYNNVIQSVGSLELTNDLSLKGTREYGVDHYTGTYNADYKNFSKTEYLFGGTSIKRETRKKITVTCNLDISEGTAQLIYVSGSNDPEILTEISGKYSTTIELQDGGSYFGVTGDKFTGKINLAIKDIGESKD